MTAASVPDDVLLAGEFFLAIEGLAMMRTCLLDPDAARPRVAEIRGIVEHFDEFPNSLAMPMTEYAVEPGYTRWAPIYDGPNPAVEGEQPVVHGILADLPRGVALDAACGTGRHVAKLAELGHEVIGVDTTEAMLAVARDLGPMMHEFAVLLRPDGQAVLSDVHPNSAITGGIAAFPAGGDLTKGIPYVRNLRHNVSEYLSAFRAAHLEVADCIEPLIDERVVQAQPAFAAIPDATRQALLGLPFLLIWRLVRAG